MRVSFIIPVYNAEKQINACSESIFRLSDYDPALCYELIFIDDGSTDRSSQILKDIKESKSTVPIIIYKQKNQGVSSARNKGIELANYEFIVFVDADDTFDSRMLYETIKEQEEYPHVDLIVYGISFDYYERGILYRKEEILPFYSGVINREEWQQNMLNLFLDNMLSPVWNKIIRKNIIIDHNIRLEKNLIVYEDLEFSLNTMRYCDSILFTQKPVYHYKQFQNHTGNRLKRIPHLDLVIDNIYSSLSYVDEAQKKEILLQLYQYLISDKVRISSLHSVKCICEDFKKWIDYKEYESAIINNKYLIQVYLNKALQLYVKGKYVSLRHRLANYIKLLHHILDRKCWTQLI